MNVVFTVIALASSAVLLIFAPDRLLPALLSGAEDSVKMALTLFCIYAVWMGLSKLAELSRLTRGASKLLMPVSEKFFRCGDEEINENISMNLSCNLLGLGGAATPYAVKAINGMQKTGNAFGQKLLFIINATSIQLIPTTVIALRAGAGSVKASDIVLPSLICTAISTALAVILYIAAEKIGGAKGRKKPWRM